MRVTRLAAWCVAIFWGSAAVFAELPWPQWRGPTLNGVSPATGLPLEWSESQNIRWKVPLPSWSAAAPIVAGDRVYVVSPAAPEEQPGEDRVGRRFRPGVGRENPGGRDILLFCFNRTDGSLRWKQTVADGNQLFGKQNLASPSPVTDGEHVWVLTGTGHVTALDLDGKQLWQRALQTDYGEFGLYWGYGASPLLYKDRLIIPVLHGAVTDDPSYVLALDKRTGETLWKVERPTKAEKESPDSYTTPTMLHYDGRDEIIVSGGDVVTAHDPQTGREVWRCGGLNPDNAGNYRLCASPVAMNGVVVVPSRVRPLIAVRGGGSGDVTATHLAWTLNRGGPDVPSPVCDGKYVYLVDDRGVAHCLDLESGKAVWGPERLESGTYSASPILADGRLYAINETAVTTVLLAGPEFKVLATNELDDGYTLASITPANGELYVRTSSHLYCIARGTER